MDRILRDNDRKIALGEITGVWGVGGWIKIRAYTRQAEDILKYPRWCIGAGPRMFDVDGGHKRGAGLVARLRQVGDRDAARALVGQQIWVPVSALPALPPGEYYWLELQGLTAVDVRGTCLGVVERILETGANDVLLLTGERERLVPYNPEVVREVDLENGRIVLDWDPEF